MISTRKALLSVLIVGVVLVNYTNAIDIFPVTARFSNTQNGYFQEQRGITFRKYTSLQFFVCDLEFKPNNIMMEFFGKVISPSPMIRRIVHISMYAFGSPVLQDTDKGNQKIVFSSKKEILDAHSISFIFENHSSVTQEQIDAMADQLYTELDSGQFENVTKDRDQYSEMQRDFDQVMNKKCHEFFDIELKEVNNNKFAGDDL